MTDSAPALEIRGLEKSYPGIRVLRGVDAVFRAGEIHGLVGENGAGKSTLIKILAGIVRPDAGSFLVNGRDVEIHSARDSRRLGLSFIHQELNLIEHQNAAENIFLGHPYPHAAWGTISWKALRVRARSILERLGADLPLNVPVRRLSTVERSLVAIARAFAESASVYFMDEPTTALSGREKESLYAVVRTLAGLGAAVVYVSHDLAEVLSLARRVTVLRDGAVVKSVPSADIDRAGLISLMTGREMTALFPPRGPAPSTQARILEVDSLSAPGVHGVSFTLARGEVLGIAGLVGSGRSELLRAIFGAHSPVSGRLVLDGRPFHPRSPQDSIKRGIAYVPEERRSQGLVLTRSILDNISLVHLRQLSRGFFLNRGRSRQESRGVGQAVALKASRYEDPVSTLSGGNQQKVVFAKYMLGGPRLFMLDEPTKGVDVGARYEIYTVIRALTSQGSGILLVSSDLSELLGLSDRLLVLHEGRELGVLDAAGLDEKRLLTLCYGKGME